MYWIVVYLIGVIITFYLIVKKVISLQKNLLIADMVFATLISLGSWISWIVFCDEAFEFFSRIGFELLKLGNKMVWRKKK
jgi:predicted small secreted protein